MSRQKRSAIDLSLKPPKAVIAAVDCGSADDTEQSLDELVMLLENIGVPVAARIVQKRRIPDPAHFIGAGKALEIKEYALPNEVTHLVVDDFLSPTQKSNLQKVTGLQVWDRAFVIMKIFESRAHTAEAKLQVELAQYRYEIPSLKGLGHQMSRTGGGIGTRGPGETKLETDRRHIRRRIEALREQLKKIEVGRHETQRRREKDGTVTVALVGYTNAGKSTLMNLLTQAGVLAEDKLFATLDPTARALKLPGGKTVMLIDTVGLVRRLPHHLVEAFRSTLEQAATADIILNVCDASSPEARTHLDVTNEILQSLGCGDRPVIPVLNKWDLVGDADSALHLTGAVRISALKNEGIPALLQAIEDNLPVKPVDVTALLPFAKTGIAAQLRKAGALVSEEYVPEGLLIHARVEPREMALIKPYIVENNSESENV